MRTFPTQYAAMPDNYIFLAFYFPLSKRMWSIPISPRCPTFLSCQSLFSIRERTPSHVGLLINQL